MSTDLNSDQEEATRVKLARLRLAALMALIHVERQELDLGHTLRAGDALRAALKPAPIGRGENDPYPD